MKIAFAGGGTAGSVTPLIAIMEELNKISTENTFLFIGTQSGKPERDLIKPYDISFSRILTGKFRRYGSILNILAPLFVLVGFFQSLVLLIKFRPNILLTAGGYVGVPCVWAAWSLGIKVVIHQPDVKPGLANVMTQMFATKVTVGYLETERFFPKNKVVLTGNPVRPSLLEGSDEEAKNFFSLTENIPIVLVIGGGMGAKDLNNMIFDSAREIQKTAYLIIVSGKGKRVDITESKRLRQYEFLTRDGIRNALHIADVIISRAGAGAISEFSLLKKACIFIPLPNSPQEKNVAALDKNNAAIIHNQKSLSAEKLAASVIELLNNEPRRRELGENLYSLTKSDAALRIAQLIISIGGS